MEIRPGLSQVSTLNITYLPGKFPFLNLKIKDKGVHFSESCRLKIFLKNSFLYLWFYDNFLNLAWTDTLPNTFFRTDLLSNTSDRMLPSLPFFSLSCHTVWSWMQTRIYRNFFKKCFFHRIPCKKGVKPLQSMVRSNGPRKLSETGRLRYEDFTERD